METMPLASTGSASTPLRVERFDDRVVATLDRPDKRNAIDQATIDALHLLCAEHPAVDLEAQADLFESPEKFRRMTEFLERRSKDRRHADPKTTERTQR